MFVSRKQGTSKYNMTILVHNGVQNSTLVCLSPMNELEIICFLAEHDCTPVGHCSSGHDTIRWSVARHRLQKDQSHDMAFLSCNFGLGTFTVCF